MTPPVRGYEVLVRPGVLDELAARAAAAAPAAAYVVIAPADVARLYGVRVCDSLTRAGLRAELLVFEGGEASKTRETWADLTDRMLALQLGRDTCVIALGGGVAGDIAGFVAATYMRGIPLVQLPTTLLAMIDASIGGKSGVDTEAGKNLVGAFHAPRAVLIDPLVLRTLPPQELHAGMAEAIKHGAILDAAYVNWIEQTAAEILALEPAALVHLIARSVELKAGVVSEDPLELGRRAILNFGHTVGHALEQWAHFRMPHGFAVAAGMCAEAELGEHLGITAPGSAARLREVLQRFSLSCTIDAPAAPLLAAMRVDKKARQAQPRVVLLRRIGECGRDPSGAWTHAVSTEIMNDVLTGVSRGAGSV